MPNPKINWVNDHTKICDRLDARLQLMQDYLDSKPESFDGFAVKHFLLHQAHEQIACYRQAIEAPDLVGCVACRRVLETGQTFLEHYLPTYNFRETEHSTEYKRDTTFPILPQLLALHDAARLNDPRETPDPGIFGLPELDTPERISHLALKNWINTRTCYSILHEIEQRGDFQITWGVADDGYSDTVCISRAATDATGRQPKLG